MNAMAWTLKLFKNLVPIKTQNTHYNSNKISMMKKQSTKSFLSFFIVSLLLLASSFSAQAANRYSVAIGNWNATSTWSDASGGASGFSFPVDGDVVYIEGGFNVTLNGNAACTSITFTTATATSLTLAGFLLDVSGGITIPRSGTGKNLIAVGSGQLNAGSIAFTAGNIAVRHEITISTGTVTVSGDVTQTGSNGSASFTFTGAGLLKLGGAFLTNATGTLTPNNGTVEYYGASQTIGDFAYNHLTLSGSGVKTLVTGTTVGGDLTLSGTASSTTVEAFSIGGNLVVGTGTTFATGATNTWTLSVSGTTSVTGTLTLNNTGTKTFTGNTTINAGGIWNETASSPINYAGNLQNDGATFTAGTGTHTFSGTTKTIGGASVISIPTATFAGNYTNSGIFTSSTLLIVTGAGIRLTNTGTITASTALSGTGGVTQGASGVLNINGTSGISILDASTNAGNTVNYTGGTQTVKGVTYSNLGLSGTLNKTLTTITINKNLSISGTTKALLANGTTSTSLTLTLGGANQATGSWGSSGSAASNKNNTWFVAANTGVLNDNISCTAGTWLGTFSVTWSDAGNWCGGIPTATTNVSISSGTPFQPTISAVGAVCKNMTINSSAILTISGSNGLTVSGNWSNSGTFIANTGTITFNGTTTISGSSVHAFNNITISGALTAPSLANTNISGNWSNSGTFTHNSGTVTFNATTQSIGGSATTLFNNLIISSGTTTLGVAANVNALLTIKSGATFALSTFSVSLGSLNPCLVMEKGTGTFITGTGLLTLGGDVSINSAAGDATGATISCPVALGAAGRTFTLTSGASADLTISGIISGSVSITKAGGGIMVLGGANTFSDVFNVTVGTLKLNNTSALGTIAGGTVVTSGAELNLNGITLSTSEPLSIAGAGIASGALLNTSGSSATYNGAITFTNNTSIETEAGNIILGSAGIAGGFSLTKTGALNLILGSGDIALNGLTVSVGTVTSTTGTLTIAGDFLNSGSFTHNGGTVNLSGAAAQSIAGTANTTFNHLTLSGGGTKTLGKATTVNGILTFSSGLLTSSSINLLTITNGGSVTGASSTSFVNGPVKKIGNSAVVFPVGKSGTGYQAISISAPGVNTDAFTAEYMRASAIALGAAHTSPITDVSACEYWTLDRTTGSSNVDVALYGNANSGCGSNTGSDYFTSAANNKPISDLRVIHWNGSAWENATAGATSVSGTSPNITLTAAAVSSFSPFTFGSVAGNPLPVKLISFTAKAIERDAVLSWSTATERNNDHFEVERSLDGINFMKVGEVNGAGNSTSIVKYAFTDYRVADISAQNVYYRLKQVDFDNAFEYSNLATVSFVKQGMVSIINVQPNPFAGNLVVSYNLPDNGDVTIRIVDAQGRILASNDAQAKKGINTAQFNTSDYAKGLYFITVNYNGQSTNYKMLVKE